MTSMSIAALQQVTFKGIRPSSSVAKTLHEALAKIEMRVGRIDHAHIVVGPASPFRVTVDLGYRHYHLFVVREALDVYAAIHEALKSAEKQMHDVKRRLEDARSLA